MRTFSKPVALARTRQAAYFSSSSIANAGYGRAASYRRIQNAALSSDRTVDGRNAIGRSGWTLPQAQSAFALPGSLALRSFTTSRAFQQSQPQAKQSSEAGATAGATAQAKESTAEAESKTTRDQDESADKNGEQQERKDGEGEKQESKKGDAPEPPHGNKTIWEVFTQTLSTEFKSSKEWNEGTKALSSGYDEVTQSEALKKAKAAYEESMRATSSTAAAAAKVVGKGAAAVWESPVGKVARKGASAAAVGIDKATKPVRETEAYKSIANTIDDGSSSRYGGWIEKEERKRRRALREAGLNRDGVKFQKMEEDPTAGTNVTLHKDAAWKESWREFRQSSKLFQQFDGLKSTYQQSDNPLVSTARVWADTIGRLFAENETAMVIKKLREMDPNFQLEPFLIEMREYILPEVLDAYVKGDLPTLKEWLSAAQYNVYAALMSQYTAQGLVSDGRILDIRNVDLASARLLDPGEVPVFVITCRTQEVHVYRKAKTGELAAGLDDKVQQVTYAIGVTRTAEDVSNPETRGWRLIELQKSARDYY